MKPATFRVVISNIWLERDKFQDDSKERVDVKITFVTERIKCVHLKSQQFGAVHGTSHSFQWQTDHPDTLAVKHLLVKLTSNSTGREWNESQSLFDVITGPSSHRWIVNELGLILHFECRVDEVIQECIYLSLLLPRSIQQDNPRAFIVMDKQAREMKSLNGESWPLGTGLLASSVASSAVVLISSSSKTEKVHVLRLKSLIGSTGAKNVPLTFAERADVAVAVLSNGPRWVQMIRGIHSYRGVVSCDEMYNVAAPLPLNWTCRVVTPIYNPDTDCHCPFGVKHGGEGLCMPCASIASLVMTHAKVSIDTNIVKPLPGDRLRLLGNFWANKLRSLRSLGDKSSPQSMLVPVHDLANCDFPIDLINLDDPIASPELVACLENLARQRQVQQERNHDQYLVQLEVAEADQRLLNVQILNYWTRVEGAALQIKNERG